VSSNHSRKEEAYDSDEHPELQPNFPALRVRILANLSSKIPSWKKLTRGRYHEIYRLQSSLGRNYIAQFSQFAESPAKLQSEAATMQYIRANTAIPAPEVYLSDVSPGNNVGM
jgi:hypothetical protein